MRVAGRAPPGSLQSAPQSQGARVAPPQARPSRPFGRLVAPVRGHGGSGASPTRGGGGGDHRRGAPAVGGWAPEGTDRAPTGPPHGCQGLPAPEAAREDLTSRYLDIALV